MGRASYGAKNQSLTHKTVVSFLIPLIQVGGVKTCLKNSQVCNIYPECDPAEGSITAEDELDCDEEYRKNRLIPKQATYRCQSPRYNEESVRNNKSLGVVWIRAALNDGNPECWKGEDEKERSTFWESYGILGLELNRKKTVSLHYTTQEKEIVYLDMNTLYVGQI